MALLKNSSNMWKCEHDTVINGEALHAEGAGKDATEIVRNMRDQLGIHSPGALSMVRRTIAELINKGGDEIIDGEDVLKVYEIPDVPEGE